ncbi:MAG: IS21-like element helper ATPase IstB [Dehalococcoidia bacterium]|nr:IS21-like element helper ATPase IstB [Dehalococcoidia bacterium]MCB9594132.1 ATP-binding protein [Sandaracinaceae bacterium]
MSLTDELVPMLKKLRLSGILHTLELRTQQAVDDELGYVDFLFRLLCDEVERREAKQLDARLRRASFEHAKTLEDFDFHFNPTIPKAKIIDLATGTFVAKRENVLLIGQAGVGKSHLAQALGHRACRLGHPVLYTSANDLFKQLRAARGDGSYDRRLLRYANPDLLILDDLGLRPLRDEEPLDLYEVIRERYERGATIVTSNRDPEELGELFGDPLLASAAMDRLLHHAHVIAIEGESYRNPATNQRKRPRRTLKEDTRP